MAARDLLLPIACDLEWQSAARFMTSVVATDNGVEKRNADWDSTLARAVIKYNARTRKVWSAIDELFQLCQGRAYAFKVRDPRKWIAEPGEGVFVGGQAVLRLTRGAYTLDKVITKLDAELTTVSGGTVNPLTGVSLDGADSWEGTFYLCMRFDTDSLEVSGLNKKPRGDLIAGFGDVPLVEVLGE